MSLTIILNELNQQPTNHTRSTSKRSKLSVPRVFSTKCFPGTSHMHRTAPKPSLPTLGKGFEMVECKIHFYVDTSSGNYVPGQSAISVLNHDSEQQQQHR